MKKRHYHIINYATLLGILTVVVLLFFQLRNHVQLQIAIGLLLSVLYVAWGLIHHAMEESLHPKIVVEYLLVGAIALVLILTVAWI